MLPSNPVAAGELIAYPFVFVQVFGDYYHFRHHAVVKRALSGHKGMHIRLQNEPQVRLLSAFTQLSAADKGQKTDWIRHTGCIYYKRKGASINDSLSNSVSFAVHTDSSICPQPNPRHCIAVNMQNKSSQTTQHLGVSLCLALLLQPCKIYYMHLNIN